MNKNDIRLLTCDNLYIFLNPGGGAFALYFRPHRWAFDSLSAPAPGNLPSIRKKKANSVGLGRGRAQLELTDALRALDRPDEALA